MFAVPVARGSQDSDCEAARKLPPAQSLARDTELWDYLLRRVHTDSAAGGSTTEEMAMTGGRYPSPASALLLAVSAWCGTGAVADTAQARCDIYPIGQDHSENSGPCMFSQRQGYITITRQDGVRHRLTPVGNSPGNFVDEGGNAVYRQSGLGRQGLIFRFPAESVYVYWGTGAGTAGDTQNPTAPYDSDHYDATTLLPCRAAGALELRSCPAGILRTEGGAASIVVTSPEGAEFTLNFMKDYVNAAGRRVEAELKGDSWTVTVDDGEFYEVPLAAVQGN
jgi:hypothetical protein